MVAVSKCVGSLVPGSKEDLMHCLHSPSTAGVHALSLLAAVSVEAVVYILVTVLPFLEMYKGV